MMLSGAVLFCLFVCFDLFLTENVCLIKFEILLTK